MPTSFLSFLHHFHHRVDFQHRGIFLHQQFIQLLHMVSSLHKNRESITDRRGSLGLVLMLPSLMLYHKSAKVRSQHMYDEMKLNTVIKSTHLSTLFYYSCAYVQDNYVCSSCKYHNVNATIKIPLQTFAIMKLIKIQRLARILTFVKLANVQTLKGLITNYMSAVLQQYKISSSTLSQYSGVTLNSFRVSPHLCTLERIQFVEPCLLPALSSFLQCNKTT